MVDKRREGESLEDYRARCYAEDLATKRHLKGTIKEGTRVVIPGARNLTEAISMDGGGVESSFTHKQFSFSKTKKKNAMQKTARKKNRRPKTKKKNPTRKRNRK